MADTPTLIQRAIRTFWAGGGKEREPLLEKEHSSPIVVFCFVINSCIGVGFLSLPRAFDRAGLLWSCTLTVVMGLVSMTSASWVVNSMSNTEALLRHLSASNPERQAIGADESGTSESPVGRELDFSISTRKNELSQMIGLLFGQRTKQVYIVTLTYLMYTCLWCFTSVFAASMAAKVPLPFLGGEAASLTCDIYTNQAWACSFLYIEHVLLFALIVVPFSVMEMRETVVFQIGMALVRFVLIGLILADACRIMFSGEAPPNFYEYDPTYYPEPSPMANPSGSKEVMSILVYAMTIQMMIPTTSQGLRNKVDTMLPTVWSALFFVMIVYLAIGFCVAFVFGNDTLPVASLNWRNFTAGQDKAPAWAAWFSNIIIIFPTLDIMSAFPLLAFCLSENLSLLFPSWNASYNLTIYWRLLAAIPPIIGALMFDNVGVLFEYGAIGAWLIMVFFPAACLLRSQQLLEDRYGKGACAKNPYRTWLSGTCVVYFTVGLCCVGYGYHLLSFLTMGAKPIMFLLQAV